MKIKTEVVFRQIIENLDLYHLAKENPLGYYFMPEEKTAEAKFFLAILETKPEEKFLREIKGCTTFAPYKILMGDDNEIKTNFLNYLASIKFETFDAKKQLNIIYIPHICFVLTGAILLNDL